MTELTKLTKPLAAALLAIGLSAPAMAEEPITGRASVIDGDTIDIAGERIRFNGIDAPESWQKCEDGAGTEYRCGKASAEALEAFLALSRPTRCEFKSWDTSWGQKRFVGDCYRADGESVSRWMVLNGHALDWPRYSGGAYSREMDLARAGRRGMWRGDFQEPWEARRSPR